MFVLTWISSSKHCFDQYFEPEAIPRQGIYDADAKNASRCQVIDAQQGPFTIPSSSMLTIVDMVKKAPAH